MQFPYVYGKNVWAQYPKVEVSIEEITPEVAEKMLEVNVANRPRYQSAISRAIENGEWAMNGETIVFSDEGVLLDGQNRLFACVAAKKPIVTMVVRGISVDAQLTMDQGKKRTVQDYLILKGIPNAKLLAPIGGFVRRADLYGMDVAVTNSRNTGATTKEIVSFIERTHADRLDRLIAPAVSIRANRNNMCLGNGTIGVFLDGLYKAGADECDIDDFVQQLSGNRAQCSSVRLLCKRFSNEEPSGGHATKQKIFLALLIKAWNAYITGTEMACLRFTSGGANPERFPTIISGE